MPGVDVVTVLYDTSRRFVRGRDRASYVVVVADDVVVVLRSRTLYIGENGREKYRTSGGDAATARRRIAEREIVRE